MTDVKAARAAVDELTQVLGWLTASLLPGTHQPYRPNVIPDDVQRARDRLDRESRHSLGYGMQVPLGESPAPMDLNVMDLLVEILTAADELADNIAKTVGREPLPQAPSAFADPSPYLDLIRDHLAAACQVDDTMARHVEQACDALVFRAHHQLGLFGDGQVLGGALCPWCGGRTAHKPAGGDRTLRVRVQLPERPRNHEGAWSIATVPPDDVRWFVVCEGVNCSPSSEDCGTWLRGRPAWDLRNEADWLAKRLEAAAVAS